MKKSYKEKLFNNLEQLKNGFNKLKNEGKETKEIIKIISLALKENRKLTIEEKKIVDEQIKDLGKLSLIVPLAILPGAPITIPALYALANKLDIDIIPSSFKEENKNNELLIKNDNLLEDTNDLNDFK